MLFSRIITPRVFFGAFLCLGLPLVGCGDDAGTGAAGAGGSAAGGSGGEGAGTNNGICIKHNCSTDDDCQGCDGGYNFCQVEAGADAGRCVACGADTGSGCPDGQVCSSFGDCVPEGAECPTEAGVPTIACETSADCVACDPAHRVCDTATNKCVACTVNDTSECQSTDICKEGECAPACSNDCTTDNDCSKCGGAKACNNHKCSECSETYACSAGYFCDLSTGTCEKNCGQQGAPGVCVNDEDCNGCGGGQVCHKAINADPTDTGTCGPDAAGCSDLGNGTLTLPPPYNQITNTCSNDGDCSGVGIQYNVGEALRDLLGEDEILGQPIEDANIEYPMDVCANVTLADTSCGVCVPCRLDDDCGDIDLDALSGDLFPGVGGALLNFVFDQVFGPNDHKLYMYCETVAAGYGVCVPCPGLLNDCAESGGGGGGGTCDHATSEVGGPLGTDCDPCAATVCANDSFCCTTEWDNLCVEAAATECNTSTCHGACETGAPMGAECGTCAADVCAADPYCCQTSWDNICVGKASDLCGGCI